MKNTIIRGDLSTITVGNHCYIGENTVVRPCSKMIATGVTYFPLRIGSNVVIDEDCIVMAAEIGDFVFVGKNSIIGQSSVIKNCCYIMENSVLAPDTIAPPFSILSGNPAKVIGKMPINTSQIMSDLTNEIYYKFIPET
jgi:dynactin-5